MHFLLATFGTDGDVFPFIGLGRELRARGHSISLAASGDYQPASEREGFKFLELVTSQEAEAVLGNPDFWHPRKCGPLAARWGVQYVKRQYEMLEKAAVAESTVLVANPGVLAARLLHDKTNLPFASVILQPWVLPSLNDPPMMPGGMGLPRWSPKWLWKIYFRLLFAAGDLLLARDLNNLRAELGLLAVQKVLSWWFSPQLILAFFPNWYGAPQPDWPQQVHTLSFPEFDGADAPLGPELEKFLGGGEPPVAITFGTGVRHAGLLYRQAIEACGRLNRRVILLTRHQQQIPDPLPPNVFPADFAPFSKLFPRCAAVIHHGGIGTTAKALAANLPQVIIPICFDQLDNAMRVERLGGGFWLSKRKANDANIARKLAKTLEIKRIAIENGSASDRSPAFTHAAEILERMGPVLP